MRITAQLIKGSKGGHVWVERYDRHLADLFVVQDEVTAKIVRALDVNLTDKAAARPERIETARPEAYYPSFSTDWVRTCLPYKRAADRDRLLEGLRDAGLSH